MRQADARIKLLEGQDAREILDRTFPSPDGRLMDARGREEENISLIHFLRSAVFRVWLSRLSASGPLGVFARF